VRKRRHSHEYLLRSLEQPGCPACRRAEHAAERYVFGFVYEHYTDWQTLEELRASLGFCEAHTRALLRRHEAQWVMRVVYEAVVPAAIEQLASARPGDHRRPCPMCESVRGAEQSLIAAVAAALSQPAVPATYGDSAGFCLPHLLHALEGSGPEETAVLVQVFRTGLRQAVEPEALIAHLAGKDCDAPARREMRACLGERNLGDTGGLHQPVMEALRRRLTIETCPSCLAGGLGERRYLSWLSSETRSNPTGLATEGVWLCPRHLHDLAGEDAEGAAWLATHERWRLEGELGRLCDRLTALAQGSLSARLQAARVALRPNEAQRASLPTRAGRALGALLRRRRAAMQEALTPFVRSRNCDACRAVGVAEERETALLLAALSDRPTAEIYEGAHGLCARHVLALGRLNGGGTPLRVLRARLAVLAWELEEAGRRASWSVRHERNGDELTAWKRAPAQLDGRVFLGAPAR
jgi:hypothetical protein